MKAATHRIHRPHSKLGQMTVWLSAAFTVMFAINILVNIFLIQSSSVPQAVHNMYVAFILFMLGCGTAGGICGLVAITKHHERSFQVWVFTLIGLFALLIFLNESVQGIMYLLTT